MLVAVALAVATSALTPVAVASVQISPVNKSSASDTGTIGVRLVDIPVDSVNNPRAHEYIIDALTPGTIIHRRILVANKTASPVHVDLYPDAAHITGGSFVGEPGTTPSELTTWTALSQNKLDLPAYSQTLDTVTITVPRDAAPSERYGVIWVQANGGHTGGNVTLVNRTGIRVYLWVGGNNPPPSNFTVDSMTAVRRPDGRGIINAQVHNTGGRALDMTGTLKLAKVNGAMTAGPYLVQLGTTMAPGQSEPVHILITDPVEDGPWTATLELKSGLLDETYQAQITFPHAPGTAPPVAAHSTATATRSTLIYLVYGLAAVVALLSAALLFIALHRRRTRTPDDSGR